MKKRIGFQLLSPLLILRKKGRGKWPDVLLIPLPEKGGKKRGGGKRTGRELRKSPFLPRGRGEN